ncbi:MAG: hypothetical protein R2737_09895 [Candidatus Nanopelagicales bacterium]
MVAPDDVRPQAPVPAHERPRVVPDVRTAATPPAEALPTGAVPTELPQVVSAPADASALLPDVAVPPTPAPPVSLPDVTRVEIELGSGTIRRGSLLGAVATVERHGPGGWVPLPDALVRLTFTPLGGGDPVRSSAVTDTRGRARFAARHDASGTWSATVESSTGTPCSTARLVVVHD